MVVACREMEAELRSLIGRYGMRAVHEGLMKEMQDTFSYLQGVFHMKNELVMPVVHSVPSVEVVKSTIPEYIPQQTEKDDVDTDSLEDISEMPADPTVKQITIGSDSKSKTAAKTPVVVKHQKQQHREEVEKKKAELIAKGVKPESLLTEENLKKWLAQGLSYQKIAKETGVHEVQVSNTCKSFGLQSSISRYVAMKKTG
jgi:hypothetical protein